jgi:acetylornithine deacetylase/succinyl-diaminopimelate desuccinylase-like protein
MNGKVMNYIEGKEEEYIASLQDFLRINSIAAQDVGMEECADFIQKTMQKIGLETKVLTLEGAYPAIYGEFKNPEAKKTLLIYGHYDVQPPEPLELWSSDPFAAEIRDEKIVARGATDDKGNLWATLMAFKSVVEVNGQLPINLKFLFEGEEEIGSPHLYEFINTYKDLLQADYTILCDRGIHESGRPQMYLGNKGIMHVEVSLKGAKRDVHSGQAPFIPNTAWNLVWLLNKLKNENEEIMIPGYYDEVIEPSAEDMELMKKIPFDKGEYCQTYQIKDIVPRNDGVSALTSLLYRPTATINGITSGYQGKGNKTIVPDQASVKIDFRFVKNQDPENCKQMIKTYLEENIGDLVEYELFIGDAKNPHKMSPNEEIVGVAITCSEEVYGEEPVVWPLLDGAGPMSYFGEILGAPAMIIGLGAPFAFANTHAPDEYIGIDEYIKGIKLMANIYETYGGDK